MKILLLTGSLLSTPHMVSSRFPCVSISAVTGLIVLLPYHLDVKSILFKLSRFNSKILPLFYSSVPKCSHSLVKMEICPAESYKEPSLKKTHLLSNFQIWLFISLIPIKFYLQFDEFILLQSQLHLQSFSNLPLSIFYHYFPFVLFRPNN